MDLNEKNIKLANAVYKVLEYLPESDPIKNKAKEKVLAIMENLTLFCGYEKENEGWVKVKSCLPGVKEKNSIQILEDILILINYLRISKSQGWISEINFLIIHNGYEKIKKEIEPFSKFDKQVLETLIASDSVLSINNEVKTSVANNKKEPELSKRQGLIIDFLEKNQKAQVSDLMLILPNVTKRTVRRDLDELLRVGRLTRKGEFNQVFYVLNR